MGVLAMVVFFFFGPFLTGLFTEDPAVHEQAIIYTVILAFSQPFVAWEALFEGCLLGAGDTRTVFWLSAPINLLRIPLAWALAFPLGWGAGGIWWAINITTVIKAALKGLAVRRGKWTTLEL